MDTTAVKPSPQAASASGATAAGPRILVASELLCESVDLRAGERVLDVGCGSGNAALAAARRYCRVVGVDGDAALLKRARRRAEAEFFAAFDGPTATALQALGPDDAGALRAELLELARRFDVSEADTLVLRLDYLEAVVHRPAWL